MPNSVSAKKRVRQNVTRRARNKWRIEKVRLAVRDFTAKVPTLSKEEAAKQLQVIYKLLDQIAATGTLHKNTASRYKSRLTLRANAVGKAPVAAKNA
jgi:small subunit ribosomal protein S20